jgi:hypothetical protein
MSTLPPEATTSVYLKRFGRPLLNQALMITVIAPFFLLFMPRRSPTWDIVAVASIIVFFWLIWAVWGGSSVEIDAEAFTVKRAGTRVYRWSDKPQFFFHRSSWKNRLAYLEVIRQDHITDTFDTMIADDGFLAEIRKYAAIETIDDLLPRRRYR